MPHDLRRNVATNQACGGSIALKEFQVDETGGAPAKLLRFLLN